MHDDLDGRRTFQWIARKRTALLYVMGAFILFSVLISGAASARQQATGLSLLSGQVAFHMVGSGEIAGTITDGATGNPIVGATVVAQNATGVLLSAITDASGRYHFQGLAPGLYDLRAVASDHQGVGQVGVLVSGLRATVNFVLAPSDATEARGAIAGRVRGMPDARPLPGATITLALGGALVAATTADGDGHFLIGDLPAGTYDLQAGANGYQTGGPADVAVHVNETASVDLVLEPRLSTDGLLAFLSPKHDVRDDADEHEHDRDGHDAHHGGHGKDAKGEHGKKR